MPAEAILGFSYVYLFILISALLVFIPAIKQFKPANSNFFQSVTITTKTTEENTTENHTASALASGLFFVIVLAISLLIIWAITTFLGNTITVIYCVFTLLSTWGFVSQLKLRNRFTTLAENPLADRLLSIALTLVLGLSWLYFPSWLTYNLIFFMMAYSTVSEVGALRIRYLFIVLLLIVIYDVWAVFSTNLIMETVFNSAVLPPLILVVPANPFSLALEPAGILGLGDILLSGIAIMIATKYGLQWWVIFGFAVGIFLALLLSAFLGQGVPAMLTLSPCLLLSLFVGSVVQKKNLEW